MWFEYGKWLVLSEVIARFASREISKLLLINGFMLKELNMTCHVKK